MMNKHDMPGRIVHLARELESAAIDAGFQMLRVTFETDEYTVEEFGNTRAFAIDRDNVSHLWAEREVE